MRIIVLGAGVIGVSSAYWLMRAGHQVSVVERREAAGLETSWGNGAIIHVSSVQPWAAPGMPLKVLKWLGQEDAPFLLRPSALPRMWRWGLGFLAASRAAAHNAGALANLELALHSARCMAGIRAETGVEYDHAGGCVLKTFGTAAEWEAAARAHEALAPHGLVTERLDRAACIAREPALAPVAEKVAGGLHFPQDEVGDCSRFSQGLAAWCAARGVAFHYGTTVTGLIQRGGRVAAVATAAGEMAGEMECDAVVVALGPHSAALLRPLGIHVPIHPVKGLSVTVPRAVWPEGPRNAILDDGRKFALTPLGERYRIVGSAEIADFDTTPAPARIGALMRGVAQLFPALEKADSAPGALCWAGLRPMVPDGLPRIGPTRLGGLYLNTGHGHTGWTMGAGSGHRIAEIIDGRRGGFAAVA
ncbi:amino acid dehydrogenase [Pseudoroseomonas rhizosphaerae]|uniref:Amino acid dehydrogenase n=1 Tax=Teichococcus rhizosphaerae TaxID=1335062 RepID=A0A2C7ABM8_9PROT|nr:D-amino acid dehydrogenase [Pseudoroseomonas rhizosphaerae]PHK94496.1 amino acid dehydrogenase [Pseudoroseomonas rhizosphaerae]